MSMSVLLSAPSCYSPHCPLPSSSLASSSLAIIDPRRHSTFSSILDEPQYSAPVEQHLFRAQPLPWILSRPSLPTPTTLPQARQKRQQNPAAPQPSPVFNPLLPPRATATALPERTADLVQKRWVDWNTTTSTIYVTNTNEVPTAITLYTTYGQNPIVDGGTLTITEYKGADTVTVLGPSYVTLTFYPTTTTYSKTTVSVPTTTKTKTKTPTPPSTATICLPGDASVKQSHGLTPTHDQSITLYVMAIYLVGIAVGWNLYGLRNILYPFKMLVIGFHEAGHLLMCLCFSIRVDSVCIDPVQGGCVIPKDPEEDYQFPIAVLPLGYLFSIFIGGLLTFCGFDTLASKIASFLIAPCWIVVFSFATGVPTKALTMGALGLLVGLWFVDHAWGLRFYVLFIGVMSSFYVLWDVGDDYIFQKDHPCCPVLYHRALLPTVVDPMIFTVAWIVLSVIFFICFVLAGLATWKESPHAMYCQAQSFLPT